MAETARNIIFIMGVSGSGKTSVGQLLAENLSIPFIEGDDYHTQANIEKMSQGIPLNDNDREPWLDKLHEIAIDHLGSGCVIACSALKEAYRKSLAGAIEEQVNWVYLRGSYEQIFTRINQRQNHFMGSDLLQSQFDTLEEPANAHVISIEATVQEMVQEIKQKLT